MSSHHIVKEKQEPALYIHSLGEFDDEALGQLLEWSPTLIVQDTEFEKIYSLGIKADFIAGNEVLANVQEHTMFINTGLYGPQAVIDYLVSEGYPAVNIITDEVFPLDILDYVHRINMVVFNGSEKIYAIKSGFTIWKPIGTRFRIEGAFLQPVEKLSLESENQYCVTSDGFVEFLFDDDAAILHEEL